MQENGLTSSENMLQKELNLPVTFEYIALLSAHANLAG